MAVLAEGTNFAGYQIDGIAGHGGMGVVYRATEIALQRPVALKLIAEDFAADSKLRGRFQRESLLSASIDHPNVIPVYEAGEVDGVLYIAMRFVDGTDLHHAVPRDHGLEPARAVRLVSQVGSALDAAHRRGLIHRDVKPANVLLTGEGDEEHVYLTDFGLVKPVGGGTSGLTSAGIFIGTVDYASPEQVQGAEADARSDVYALGCVLYFTLTGKSPFRRDSNVATMFAHINEPPPSLLEARPQLPPALAAVIQRALAKAPDDRHQSAGELARDAQAALGSGSATDHAGPGDRFTRPADATPAPSTAPGAPATPAPGTDSATARAGAAGPPGTPVPAAGAPAAAGMPPMRRRLVGFGLAAVLVLGVVAALLAALGVFEGDETPSSRSSQTEPTATAAPPSKPRVAASIPVGKGPDGIAVTDEGIVFVTDATRGTFSRIDPKTNRTIGKPVEVGRAPDGVAGAKKVAWIASSGDGRVRRVESDPNPVVVGTIRVGAEPNGVSLGKQLVWVSNTKDDTLTRIDRASATVVGSPIGVGDEPYGVFVGADNVWVANHGDDTVSRVDSSTAEVIGAPTKVGRGPRSVAEAFGFAWVANADDGTVSRLDAKTGKVAGEPIRVGRDPRELAVGGGFVWVANAGDNSVSQIDPKAARVVGRAIPVGDDPIGIAFGAGAVWTANFRDGTVTRIQP
jgi:serine/threonine-protein kinase